MMLRSKGGKSCVYIYTSNTALVRFETECRDPSACSRVSAAELRSLLQIKREYTDTRFGIPDHCDFLGKDAPWAAFWILAKKTRALASLCQHPKDPRRSSYRETLTLGSAMRLHPPPSRNIKGIFSWWSLVPSWRTVCWDCIALWRIVLMNPSRVVCRYRWAAIYANRKMMME